MLPQTAPALELRKMFEALGSREPERTPGWAMRFSAMIWNLFHL